MENISPQLKFRFDYNVNERSFYFRQHFLELGDFTVVIEGMFLYLSIIPAADETSVILSGLRVTPKASVKFRHNPHYPFKLQISRGINVTCESDILDILDTNMMNLETLYIPKNYYIKRFRYIKKAVGENEINYT